MQRTVARILVVLGCLTTVVLPPWLEAQSDAAGIVKSKCVLCLGANGDGNTPSGKPLKAKDLKSAEVESKSDAELTKVITNGQNKMPAFGQKLKPEQIQQMVSCVREFTPPSLTSPKR
jgi:cytochrome c6